MKTIKNIISLTVSTVLVTLGLFAFATTAKAQFNPISVGHYPVTCPAGVNGNSATNATTTCNVSDRGFSFMATFHGTNVATTGNLSLLWRASVDGTLTNTGPALYTNTVASTGTTTNRFYGTVPASAICNGVLHLSLSNANDATNRLIIDSVEILPR